MPIQSGFDGLKLVPDGRGQYPTSDLRDILSETGDKYRQYARALDYNQAETSETFWRLSFAILSVHSPIGATFAAYRRLRLAASIRERMPSRARTATLLAGAHAEDGVILYANQKAGYLKELEAMWRTNADSLTRNSEDDVRCVLHRHSHLPHIDRRTAKA